jgi:hypothetical protein
LEHLRRGDIKAIEASSQSRTSPQGWGAENDRLYRRLQHAFLSATSALAQMLTMCEQHSILRSQANSKCFEICDQIIDLNGAEIAESRHLAFPSGNDCSYR